MENWSEQPWVLFYQNNLSENHKGMLLVYLQFTNSGQAYARVCYSNQSSNRTKVKPIPIGGYNNI